MNINNILRVTLFSPPFDLINSVVSYVNNDMNNKMRCLCVFPLVISTFILHCVITLMP